MQREKDSNPVSQEPSGILTFRHVYGVFLVFLCLFLVALVVPSGISTVLQTESSPQYSGNDEISIDTPRLSPPLSGDKTAHEMYLKNPVSITVPFRDFNTGEKAVVNLYHDSVILPDATYVEFRNGWYYRRLGRVWMTVKPLDNYRITGLGMQQNGLIVTGMLWKNCPVVYRYELGLLDWDTRECDNPWDESTCFIRTAYAKDSTIGISQSGWGPISVRVNGDSVIVLQSPQPMIDAAGTSRKVRYILDEKNRTISLSLYGNRTGLKYPLSFTMSV